MKYLKQRKLEKYMLQKKKKKKGKDTLIARRCVE